MTRQVQFIEIGHDDDCPGRHTDGDGCTCNYTVRLHRDVYHFMRGEAINRAARRKARREAAKAIRKARVQGSQA